MKKQLKKLPTFATEQEERAFWENEATDSTEYFDWSKATRVQFVNLKPSAEAELAEKAEAAASAMRGARWRCRPN